MSTLARLTDDEIIALLEAEPLQAEELARAVMVGFRLVTGKRSSATATLTPTSVAVTVPANSYLAVINGTQVDEQHLFKLVPETLVDAAGTEVTLVSAIGGARSNLPAGTRLRWVSPVPGLPEEVVLTSDAEGATTGRLKACSFYEGLEGPSAADDFFGAQVGEFPAALVVWERDAPTESGGGVSRGDTRGGKGELFFRSTYSIFVASSTLHSDAERRRDGLRLVQQMRRLLTEQEVNGDGEVLSTRGTLEIMEAERYLRTASSYVYRFRVQCTVTFCKLEQRYAEPWVSSNLKLQQGSSPVNQLTVHDVDVRMLGDMPNHFLGVYSGTANPGAYQVDLALACASIGEPCGMTNYPTIGAGGYLVLREVNDGGNELVCDEVLTFGTGVATDRGRVTLTRTPGSTGASYAWTRNGSDSSGTLAGFAQGGDLHARYFRLWRGSVRGLDCMLALSHADEGELCGLIAYPGKVVSGVLRGLAVAAAADVTVSEGISLGSGTLAAGTIRLRSVGQQLIPTHSEGGGGRMVRFLPEG